MQRPVKDWPATHISSAPRYIPSPTIEDFILSARNGPRIELRVLELMGPRGEGKTLGCMAACLALADRVRQEWPELLPVRGAVMRDTMVNLERTVCRSIADMGSRGLALTWKDDRRNVVVGPTDRPLLDLHFFGLDRPGDVDKLQGFECGILWPEEVAPAADLSSGIPAEAFGVGITSLRQPGIPKRVFLPLNPPDEDAWILKVEQELEDMGLPNFLFHAWHIPPGEKERHFRRLAQMSDSEGERGAWTMAADEFAAYREWCSAALRSIGRLDLESRLVGGEIGEVKIGEPVVPNFVRAVHVVPALEPIGHGPIIRAWDGGGSPSTVICQPIGDDGRAGLNILASHTTLNGNMEQHIRDWVLPTMSRRGLMPTQSLGRDAYTASAPRRRAFTYRDFGDPSLQWEGGTVKSQNTSGLLIQEMLGTALEPGPVEWDARREALLSAFSRIGGGERQRFVQIDKRDNALLIAALGGRFRYPKDMGSGRITMTVQAAKKASGSKYSGVPDALAYALAILYPAAEWVRAVNRRPVPSGPKPRSWLGT